MEEIKKDELKVLEKETITVTREELKGIVADAVKMELNSQGTPKIAKRVPKHIGWMRVIHGNPVIKIKKTWTEPAKTELNPDTEARLFAEFITIDKDDKENSYKLDYLHLTEVNENRIPVDIMERKIKTKKISDGFRSADDPNPASDITGESEDRLSLKPGEIYEQIVEIPVEVLKIKFLAGGDKLKGRELIIDGQTLNM